MLCPLKTILSNVVPGPEIDVTLSHDPPLYAGTGLTLICSVILDPSVDSGEKVVTEWRGHQNIPAERYSVTPASRIGNIFTGNLTISPLADQDDGTYTCTGRVNDISEHKETSIIVLCKSFCEQLQLSDTHLILPAMFAVPYGAPEGFEAEAGEREVAFSWLAPLALDTEIVITYTLSCSPSPASLPQSLNQTTLTVAGFSPNTSYSCSVYIVDKNGLGSGPHNDTTFETLEDCKATMYI